MGLLQIECYCNEAQMKALISKVANRLYAFLPHDVEDVDEECMGMRICVYYDVFMGKVKIKSAEILDKEWDMLYEDSAVFYSRLRAVVNNYNAIAAKGLEQAREIHMDRMTDINIYNSILD